MKHLLTALLCLTALTLQAQNPKTSYTSHLRQNMAGKGVVTIRQSQTIENLVNNVATPTPAKKQTPKPAATESHATDKHETKEQTETHKTRPHTTTGNKHYARTRHKARGYRICIFTGGNSRADKVKAKQMGDRCKALFGELATYTSFIPPRWVTHVGDFRTKEDAQKYVTRIRKARISYEVRIVSSEVNLPD